MARIADSFMIEGTTPAIKFCGLSHLSDVAAMNELAPDYVGLVFWPKSKRVVDTAQAQALREALDDGIRTVGVFVDESVEAVASLFDQGIISVAQLHGSEDDAYIAELRERTNSALEIWKAFEVKSANDITRANASSADLVLLDGGKGEGNTFPWELLEGMTRPYALAGGLTPENVANALGLSHPVVVDVSSGIERDDWGSNPCSGRSSLGENVHRTFSFAAESARGPLPQSSPRKDPRAMAAFIKHVRG